MPRKPELMFGKFFPASIKTKAFIKPYLESLYGNPVIFNCKNYFGRVVSGLLERPYDASRKKTETTTHRFNQFNTELIIYLPKWWVKEYKPFIISEKGMIAFNGFFEAMFDEDLYKFCEMGRMYNVERKKAIEDFCMRHHISIEEDITYDCLQKKEYRFKKNIEEEKKKNPAHLSSHYRKII